MLTNWLSRLINPFCPPVAPGESEELRRQYRAVVVFVYIGVIIVAGFARLNAKLGNTLAAQVQYAMALIGLGALVLNKRGLVRTTAHACLLITAITIGIGMWTGGGMEAAAVLFLPMLPVVGLLTVGRGGGLAGMIEGVLLIAIVATLQKLGYEPRHDPPDKLFVKRVAEATVAILQIWIFCGIFFRFKHDAFSLLERNRDELARLFDGMTQAALTFDAEGRVRGRSSARSAEIFGQTSFEGASIVELLFGETTEYDLARQEVAGYLDALFHSEPADITELLTLAPRTCIRNAGKSNEQHLVLEFRPLLKADRIASVLLLVSDDTERVLLERARDHEKDARAEALAKMRRQSTLGARPFVEFLRLAEERLTGLEESVNAGSSIPEIERALRIVHTVRGEAKLHDVGDLSHTCEGLEDRLASLRRRALACEVLPQTDLLGVRDGLRVALGQVVGARDALVASSQIGAAILDQVTVSATDLKRVWETVRAQAAAGSPQVLEQVTSRLLARPFGETVASLPDALQRWCEQDRKRAALAVSGREVRIGAALGEILPGVLAHLVRNAVAHGIEPEEIRRSRDKSELGRVDVACEEGPLGPIIRVRDDGNGLDFPAIERRARELGVSTSGVPADLIYVDGFSTANEVTALRGRGVGMSAVRADLAKVGYDIEAESAAEKGTTFTLKPRLMQATAAA